MMQIAGANIKFIVPTQNSECHVNKIIALANRPIRSKRVRAVVLPLKVAALAVPDAERAAVTAGGQFSAVGRPAQRLDPVAVPLQDAQRSLCAQVPQPRGPVARPRGQPPAARAEPDHQHRRRVPRQRGRAARHREHLRRLPRREGDLQHALAVHRVRVGERGERALQRQAVHKEGERRARARGGEPQLLHDLRQVLRRGQDRDGDLGRGFGALSLRRKRRHDCGDRFWWGAGHFFF